ncbi:hypothetical protein [Lacticaseibacillus kribbianus]|uniref:hypothetical protein n=1 Tax=Lacticaseibacillus kribbianus TaxID=2926292 RepID=UPI001CD69AD2|nr:hypothetical protein [Lacticaseibacillus kribbianus]
MTRRDNWLLTSILSLSLVGGCASLITGLIPHLERLYPAQSPRSPPCWPIRG